MTPEANPGRMSLLGRVKQRALFKWAAAYAAAAWLTLEILGFLADHFFWPPAIVRGATIALAVGVAVVLVLAWFHGERGRQKAGGGELLIIAALLLAGGVLVAAFAPGRAGAPGPGPSRTLLPAGEARGRSVAVLPFENLSTDPENAFFADGIHESILTRLSTIHELRVLSRASMIRYRDTELTVRQIADEVGAGAVLRGSVQRIGDRIRISVQLIDPVAGENRWARQFDARTDELFDVQSTVALQVAEELEASLDPSELDAFTRPSTESAPALEFYLQAREASGRLRADDNEEAIRLFGLAIAEDSAFALAWAGLGRAYLERTQRFGYPMVWTDSAETLGRRAIALDSTVAEGYSVVGFASALRGHYAEAIRWFERALDLNRGMHMTAASLAVAHIFTGDWAEALRRAKHAFRLEPSSAPLRGLLANSYQDLLEFEIAERWLEEALALDPRSISARRQEQALEILRGRPELGYRKLTAFIEESEEADVVLSTVAAVGAHYAREFDDVLTWSDRAFEQAAGGALRDYHDLRVIRAYALGRGGLTPDAIELLASAERDYSQPIEQGADSWVFPLYLSAIHLVRGATGEGLDWFERAAEAGFNGWNLVEEDPIFDAVREEPRYREAIAAMRGRLDAYRRAIRMEERAAGERP